MLAGCAGSAGTVRPPSGQPGAAGERRILVMIADPQMGTPDLRGARSGVYRQPRAYAGTPERIARVLAEVAAEFGLQPVEGWPMRSLGVHCAVFEVERGRSINSVIESLHADARVESVQPMQRFELQRSSARDGWDDPYLPLQHSLSVAGIADAHRWSTGKGVRIAVIDTGVAVKHPDLRGQALESRDFVGGGPEKPDRHGTAVAGVIASVAGNRRGIVGVAPDARLLTLRACEELSVDGRGACTSFSLARALDHAIVARSDVLNLSLGGPRDPLLARLVARALAQGIVVVAARGDDMRHHPFPTNLDGVIAVSASTPDGAGRLNAPGQDVLTLVPPDGYDYLSGSSMAAAHVSGIVALLLEREPALRAADIEPLLARTSRPIRHDDAGSPRVVSACDALAQLSGSIDCR
jgi:subtilisin family serine protease